MSIHPCSDTSLKKVRFVEEDNCVIQISAEDAVSSLWLGSEEYIDLKKEAREQADFLRFKGYGVLLKRCFDSATEVQKHINALAQLPGAEYPLGVEQYLSQQHGEERDWTKDKVRQAVLNRQHILTERNVPAELVSEKLRAVSRKHSRGSRIFARRLGIGLEHALNVGDDAEVAQSLVKSLNLGNAKRVSRRHSLNRRKDGIDEGGVATMMGMAYLSSKFSQHNVERISLAPSRPTNTDSCVNLIQNALDLLEFDNDEISPLS